MTIASVLIFCILASMLGSLQADVTRKPDDKKKSKDTVSIPEARDVAVRFVAGQSVDIELDAAVGSLKQPDFIIRQQPEHGTLSNLRPHQKESNKAIITYTHAGTNEALTDKFTYACRLDGGPMSAPAVVTLTGQRMEPKLSLVNAPSFAKVFAGGESSSSIFLKNDGTAAYAMNIAWPEGWSGPPTLEIPMGKTVEIQVFFRPKKVGEFRFEGELQKGVPSSKLFLYGECLRPLTISPSSISLALDSKTGVRTGTFSLVNARPESVQVNLKLPPRINGPAELNIPAQGKMDVSVFLAVQDVEAYQGEIQVLIGTAAVEKISIQAAAKPAELQLVAPEKGVLDFGSMDQRKTVEREIILLNAGGEAMVVQADCRLPFSVEDSGKALRIEPRQQRSLKVKLKSETSGKLSQELKIAGGLNTISVGMIADVREVRGTVELQPSPMPSSVPAPLVVPTPLTTSGNDAPPTDGTVTRSPRQSALMSYLQMEGWPVSKDLINPYLERVMSMEMVAHTATGITIAWKKPDIAPVGWVLEYSSQIYDPSQGFTVKSWARFNNWKLVEGAEDKVTVQLHTLRPSAQYEFRVMGVDRGGKVSEPSPRMLFATKGSWRIPSWLWRTLLVVALGLIVYVLYRVRRGDFEED